MAEDAILMTKLRSLIESQQNVNGAVEKYIEICFNHEHGIREPVIGTELKAQIELRQFMETDPRNKDSIYDFIKYMFYQRGLGRTVRTEPYIMDLDDDV